MTLPPEKIGDRGLRFEIKFSTDVDAIDDERTLGYSSTLNGAEQMAASWRKHPEGYFVWIVDRHAEVTNEVGTIETS
jgi:hypothetical protein